MQNNYVKAGYILATGIVMGILFAFQSKSVESVQTELNRENDLNFFTELQILKQGNDNLRQQYENLENELVISNDKELLLSSLEEKVEDYRAILGKEVLTGPGIEFKINKQLRALWLTDIVNELNTLGAEAISINDIVITEKVSGFDNIPNGQVMVSGNILLAPYTIKAIGPADQMEEALMQEGGIISRMQKFLTDYNFEIERIEELRI